MARSAGRKIGYPEQQKELTEVRASFEEYEEVPVHVLQNALLRLERAFENFFRRCEERKAGKRVRTGFPRFKGREHYRSLICPDPYNYVRNAMKSDKRFTVLKRGDRNLIVRTDGKELEIPKVKSDEA